METWIYPFPPAALVAVFLFVSCGPPPSPLYGTWADNLGDTLSFFDDNTFNARIDSNGSAVTYEGNYNVLLNSLVLTCTNMTLRIVTEWDIRGNNLDLIWVTSNRDLVPLTLFKISN
jgi:hypothetical protein